MSYIYIGEYYHKHNATTPVPNDKKIGCSVNVPNREASLNSTNMTIGFRVKSYWQVGEQYRTIETAIHALLGNARFASTEFFSDDDKTLHRRLTDFMYKMGYKLCDGKEKPATVLVQAPVMKQSFEEREQQQLQQANEQRATEGLPPYVDIAEFRAMRAAAENDDEQEANAFLAAIRAKRRAAEAELDAECKPNG